MIEHLRRPDWEALVENVRAELRPVLGEFQAPADAGSDVVIPAEKAGAFSGAELARFIDHTLLKPESTADVIRGLCEEARRWGCAAVCVHPCRIGLCVAELEGSDTVVGSVVGFPHGATTAAVKAGEASLCVDLGARELDMVINVGLLRDEEWTAVMEDIQSVVRVARGLPVKVILEACYLTDREILQGCLLAQAAGAAFVKTSTGLGPHGARLEDVTLMRLAVGPAMGVKAAGGIRDAATARAMLAAGANRLGASATGAIVADVTGTDHQREGY